MADKLGGIGQSYGRFRPRKTVTIDDARLTYIRSTYGSFRRPGQQVWTELGSISAVPEIEKNGTEMAVAYLDVTTLHPQLPEAVRCNISHPSRPFEHAGSPLTH